jgi:predicted ATPase
MDLAEHIGDQSMLLLLDNFEHVLEAAGELALVLSVCPNVNVLVTSREPLHIGGEHEYAVPTLHENDAITLFVARATSVDQSFGAIDAVAEICRRLDNLPLAVELAAARVKALTPKQILERLEPRLPLLIGGARDVPERQRTLRATIEWSYELLTSDERHLFARLSAFFGGCTLDAAEQVADADVDTLQSLVDKSLLRRRVGRYWMLETIREFAAEQLTGEGEHDATSARHADYFVALAEQAEPAFDTSDEATWTERLVQDHDNFRAALAHLSDSPQQLRLACALSRFWQRQGSHSEGRRWLEAALTARAEAPPRDVARALRGVAVLARIQGDLYAAERSAAESASIARRTGDRRLEMHAVGTLANIAIIRRDYERGMDLHLRVEALARELGDENSVAVTIGNRAYLALEQADFELALALAAETLALSRKISNSANATVAALNLAIAAHALRRQRAARDALTEAIERARALGLRAFLIDGLIIAAAVVVPHDSRTATALLAAADRGLSELTIELEPVERDLHASVESQLPQRLADEASDEASRGDLDAVLEAAAARALRSLSS